jgi:hypothetical protein
MNDRMEPPPFPVWNAGNGDLVMRIGDVATIFRHIAEAFTKSTNDSFASGRIPSIPGLQDMLVGLTEAHERVLLSYADQLDIKQISSQSGMSYGGG